MAGWIYRAVTLLAAALLWIPFRLHPRGKIRLADRYGWWKLGAVRVWWFHGASAGEVLGLLPVIERVRQALPDVQILLTATSPTGLERAPEGVEFRRLLTFDHPIFLERALRGVTVERVITAETELWPELALFLKRRGVPLYLVNARLSERTVKWYRLLSGLVRQIDSAVQKVLVADEASSERFRSIGFSAKNLTVTGNAKYDATPRFEPSLERASVRQELGWSGGAIVVLGSLRPGEEVFWFPAINRMLKRGTDLKFVVAPRHREKFEFFAGALEREGIEFQRRSQRQQRASQVPVMTPQVLLLDTFGELERFYAAADLASIGATLVPIGGHNPLEPAMYGVPVVLGPHVAVIAEIAHQLWETNGAWHVESVAEIEAILDQLIAAPGAIRAAGEKALEVYKRQRGATDRIVAALLNR
jgi:3-deoxy-D-manno-octulosonic-acid transferase